MTPEQLEAIKTILQLGWPAIVTLFFVVLAREYKRVVDDRVKSLEARIAYLEATLMDCLSDKI